MMSDGQQNPNKKFLYGSIGLDMASIKIRAIRRASGQTERYGTFQL